MNRSCYLWSNKHTSCHAISETTYEQKHTSSFNNEQKLPSLVKQTYKLVPSFFAVHSKYGNYQFHHSHHNRQIANVQWIFKLIFTYYQNGLLPWRCKSLFVSYFHPVKMELTKSKAEHNMCLKQNKPWNPILVVTNLHQKLRDIWPIEEQYLH